MGGFDEASRAETCSSNVTNGGPPHDEEQRVEIAERVPGEALQARIYALRVAPVSIVEPGK
jgi:hypothetical protein